MTSPAPAIQTLTAISSHPLRLIQALEDALIFRRARSMSLCADCAETPGGRCDDHACDLELITGYQQDLNELHHAVTSHITPPAPGHS